MKYARFFADSISGSFSDRSHAVYLPGTFLLYILAAVAYLVTVKLLWGGFFTFMAIWALTAEASAVVTFLAFATFYSHIRRIPAEPLAALHAFFVSLVPYLLLAPLGLFCYALPGGGVLLFLGLLVLTLFRVWLFFSVFTRFAGIAVSTAIEFIVSGVALSLLVTVLTALFFWLFTGIFVT